MSLCVCVCVRGGSAKPIASALTSCASLKCLRECLNVSYEKHSTFLNAGDRCNVAGSSSYKKAVVDGNYDKALQFALKLVEHGAHVIDINMDVGER